LRIAVRQLEWSVVVRPATGCDHVILASKPRGEETPRLQEVITEMRPFGFSASGTCLVVVTSGDI
jgi:hypothetical protein